MKRVCVYCGSSPGGNPIYRQAAQTLGRALAHRGLELVYGGASIGVMGALADAVLAEGGTVLGVIPEALARREVAHPGLTELVITPSMHVRKMRMAQAADAFVALPGGIGTFEELFEIWTWAQLGIHGKPVALLNVAGYFDHLIALVDHAVAQGFLRPEQRALLWVEAEVQPLLDRLIRSRAAAPEHGLRIEQG
ncbi:MAG: TIGR00730 family Rossman fold protein [Rhodoferax sp.]